MKLRKQYRSEFLYRQSKNRSRNKSRKAVREAIARAKMRPCVDCNIQYNPWVMDFDHRDPFLKRRDLSKCITMTQFRNEVIKCDVVCANCHRERTQRQVRNRPHYRFSYSEKIKKDDSQIALFS